MKVTRIYTAADGEAYFQDVDIPFESAELGAHSAMFPVEKLFFRLWPAGHERGYHVAPRRQWLLLMNGVIEIECKGGKRRFSRGDILFAEDVSGRGHITRNIEGDRIFAYLPVPDDFKLGD